MPIVDRGFADDFAAGLASTLSWWNDAGVDCLVAEQPRQWLKAFPEILPGTGRGTMRSVVEGPAMQGIAGDGAAAPSGRDPSTTAFGGGPPPRFGEELTKPLPAQLGLFQDWLRSSDTLPYASPAAPRVCPSGDPASGLMILAAMPSTDDCAQGVLLSGSAGRLFDRMLAAIGRDRESAYLAGLSCFRPPAGRFDAAGAARCADIARHHIALAEPKAVLVLGDDSAKALFGLGAAQARGRPQKIEADGRAFTAIVTLSPDYLLTQPAAKGWAWADLQLLMDHLK